MRDTLADQLELLIRASPWFMAVLRAARDVNPPDWWIGAGALRDLVWDGLHGGFVPTRVKDVDLAFFDPLDFSKDRDVLVERELTLRMPNHDGALEVTAPYGVRDLLTGVCRRNPERVSIEEYQRRLEAKQVSVRWPKVRIIAS